ncbi:hypothetical protein B0H11DRAFT_2004363 [Mycena galericulata]|nr:hypothetical protein B0H11DRAFT_2004363 [Mycena galericulata]
MAIPTSAIIEAARRAWNPRSPLSIDEIRGNLEWVWGLEHGTFDEHLAKYSDPHLVDVLMDDNLILLPHSDLIINLHSLTTTNVSTRFSKPREKLQDVYPANEPFEYMVLPVDPSMGPPPRVLKSPVPPHLTISLSIDTILRRRGYLAPDFVALRNSLLELVETCPPDGATFIPDVPNFIELRYMHEVWATCYVPPRFLGLDDSDPDDEDDSEGMAESSTMEWEVQTLSNYGEPRRRMLPHEFERDPDPIIKIGPVPSTDDDDAITCDSYITGIEDPEELIKASIARGDYEPSRTWLKGMERWVQGASDVVDGDMLLNDGQIAEDSTEQPRVATSLDLNKPDYLSRPHKTSLRRESSF